MSKEEVRDRRLPAIQALRGVAASLVVFFHFSGLFKLDATGQPPAHSGGLGNLGAAGVDIFFVISGFIMVYTAGRREGAHDAISFLGRRALRIFPLYWVWTTLMLILRVAGIGQHSHQYSGVYLLKSYLLIPAFNGVDYQPLLPQEWTLTFEMVFYLIFCFAVLAGVRTKILFASVAFETLALFSGALSPDGIARQLFRQPIVIEFLLGGLAAEALFVLNRHLDMRTRRNMAIALGSVGSLALVATAALPDPVSVRSAAYGIPAFLLVLGAGLLGATAAPRLLVYLGDCSYSIYLAHVFFALGLHTAFKHVPVLLRLPQAAVVLLASTVTIGLSSLTYSLVERRVTWSLPSRARAVRTEPVEQFAS
jgi:peptidoglycan/LPS O-acetylase OafA/YrhL